MTIHIPRWSLFAGGAILIALLAFVIGRGTGGDSESSTSSGDASQSSQATEVASCDGRSARKAIDQEIQAHGDPVGTLVDESSGKLGGWVAVQVQDCQDLNGDGSDEMVTIADGVKAGGAHLMTWFVLGQEEGEWASLLRREIPVPKLSVSESGVQEKTGIYRSGDAMCCASSKRGGEVKEEGGEFKYFPDIDPGNYEIQMNPKTREVESFGPLDAYTSSASETMQYFGEPNFTGIPGGEGCSMTWSDLGMIIDFVDLGGGNACLSGKIGRFSLQGNTASQVGWRGPDGLRIGMSLDEAQSKFSQMERDYSSYADPAAPDDAIKWNLVLRPSPYGTDGTTPTISGYFKDDQLVRIEYGVGAGGE